LTMPMLLPWQIQGCIAAPRCSSCAYTPCAPMFLSSLGTATLSLCVVYPGLNSHSAHHHVEHHPRTVAAWWWVWRLCGSAALWKVARGAFCASPPWADGFGVIVFA
jgi:hypothetical protein